MKVKTVLCSTPSQSSTVYVYQKAMPRKAFAIEDQEQKKNMHNTISHCKKVHEVKIRIKIIWSGLRNIAKRVDDWEIAQSKRKKDKGRIKPCGKDITLYF